MMAKQMPTRLYLIRHGETSSAQGGRCYGQTDLPLSEKGREQMALLANRLSGIQPPPCRLYCSDLARSRESAGVLAGKWGLDPIVFPELREIDMGLWEGLSFEEINRLFPGETVEWATGSSDFRFPQGENLHDLEARVLRIHQKIISENRDGGLAIVGHAGPNRIILCQALGVPLAHLWRLGQDYGGLSIIDYHGDFPLLSLMNLTPAQWSAP